VLLEHCTAGDGKETRKKEAELEASLSITKKQEETVFQTLKKNEIDESNTNPTYQNVQVLQTLSSGKDVTSFMQLSSNTFAASCNFENNIKIWSRQNSENFSLKQSISDYGMSLLKISENLFVSDGFKDNQYVLNLFGYENDEFKLLQNIVSGHSNWVFSFLKLSDNLFVSGSEDKSIKLWKLENNNFTLVKTLNGHEDRVKSLVKLSEKLIASASFDKTIKVWNVETGENIQTLKDHEQHVLSLEMFSNNLMFSVSEDFTIKLWKLSGATLSLIYSLNLPGHELPPTEENMN